MKKSENLKIQDATAGDVIYVAVVAMETNSTARGFN